MNSEQKSYAIKLAETFPLQLLGAELAHDIKASISKALKAGTVFIGGNNPGLIFKNAVAAAITNIEERSSLLRHFLRYGPYEGEGDIPPELKDRRLTDDETRKAITFIFSHVVNCFQGNIAELLAVGACVQLVELLKKSGKLPPHACLYFGDAVRALDAKSGNHHKPRRPPKIPQSWPLENPPAERLNKGF